MVDYHGFYGGIMATTLSFTPIQVSINPICVLMQIRLHRCGLSFYSNYEDVVGFHGNAIALQLSIVYVLSKRR
jgi:hypothetical protein